MRSTISVLFGRSVSGIVRRHEGELLFARGELLVGALALPLEALAHPQQAELDAQLQHVERVAQHALRRLQLGRLLAHHLAEDVAPPEHAPRDLLQRGGASRRQLAEDVRGLPRGVVRDLEAVAGDPARDRRRRVGADPFEARLHRRVDGLARVLRALDGHRQHVVGTREHALAEAAHLLGLTELRADRRRRGPRPSPREHAATSAPEPPTRGRGFADFTDIALAIGTGAPGPEAAGRRAGDSALLAWIGCAVW